MNKVIALLKALFVPKRAPIPNLKDLWAHSKGARRLVYLIATLVVIQIILDTTIGLVVRNFLDNLALQGTQALSSPQLLAIVLFYLVLNFYVNPAIEGWQALSLSKLNEHIRVSVTLGVYDAIQERRLSTLNITRMETQVGTQPNSIHHGFQFGVKPLIENASAVAGAIILIMSALYGPMGLAALLFAIVFWLMLHNTIGQWHFASVQQALSVASNCERLLRHLVRLAWLIYYWIRRDKPARRQVGDNVRHRAESNIKQERRGEIYKWCLLAGTGTVLVVAVFITILNGGVHTASFVSTGVFLLVIQSDKLLSALKAIGSAGTECQHISFGFERIKEGVFEGTLEHPIEMLPPLSQEEEERLERPLEVAGAQLEVRDVSTGKLVSTGLQFTFVAGQVVLITGKYMAGKTPLLYAMMGLQRPLGRILFNGVSSSSIRAYDFIGFPKTVFNNDLTLLETLGGPGPQRALPQRENIQAWLKQEQMREELIILLDVLARALGIEDILHALPKGYDTLMFSVKSLLSPDHLWGVALIRELVTNGQLPRLLILDQALDLLSDPKFFQKTVNLLNSLARQHDVLIIVTSENDPAGFKGQGLIVDQVVDLEQYRPA